MKTLDQFDLADSISQVAVAAHQWVDGRKRVRGPIGTGKTHLAISLGVEAAPGQRRRRQRSGGQPTSCARSSKTRTTPKSWDGTCAAWN